MKNTKYDYNIFARGKKKVHRRILRDAAKRENVSEGEIVRRAIEAYAGSKSDGEAIAAAALGDMATLAPIHDTQAIHGRLTH